MIPAPPRAQLVFDVPDGRLAFTEGDMDRWAEHLAWCYRFLGVGEGATIAVQDFGTSPLSFLGSRLLMPTLGAGVAERLGGRMICLDASEERVLLTPAVIDQLQPDVLVVRADVLGLLLEVGRGAGVDLAGVNGIVSVRGDLAVARPGERWRYLLHVEPCLLLAPECTQCRSFHLRAGFYGLRDGAIENRRLPSALPYESRSLVVAEGICGMGAEDRRIRVPLDGGE
ncbi:MAG TPA: hypothetical protein VFA46_01680 [Actinomycetes bacterium]|jgi:hypothetical protein|nr:hypothetical protein [Actinomycetes bacterium]